MNSRTGMKSPEPSGAQAARRPKELMDQGFGIGNRLDFVERRECQRHGTPRIVRGLAEGRLVEKEPGLLHLYGHDADDRWVRQQVQVPANFPHAEVSVLPLGIAVDEQEVAGIELNGGPNLFGQGSWWLPQPTEICPLRLKAARRVLLEQPTQHGEQDPIGRAVGKQSETQ
jgi:hypothetical protein